MFKMADGTIVYETVEEFIAALDANFEGEVE